MPEPEPASEWVTIFNPVNGLPWECPNTEDALAYWVGEKKFTKTANKSTPNESVPRKSATRKKTASSKSAPVVTREEQANA